MSRLSDEVVIIFMAYYNLRKIRIIKQKKSQKMKMLHQLVWILIMEKKLEILIWILRQEKQNILAP